MRPLFYLTKLHSQIRLYHWQSLTYAEHKAFGETYETLSPLIDEFVETYLGRYGNNQKDVPVKVNISFDSFNLEHAKTVIDTYIADLYNVDSVLEISEKDTDLLNIRDSIVGALHKLKYLLTLT